MHNSGKREYNAPRLVEYGKLEEITRGSGFDFIDFIHGRVNDDGNLWGIGGGSSHSST